MIHSQTLPSVRTLTRQSPFEIKIKCLNSIQKPYLIQVRATKFNCNEQTNLHSFYIQTFLIHV